MIALVVVVAIAAIASVVIVAVHATSEVRKATDKLTQATLEQAAAAAKANLEQMTLARAVIADANLAVRVTQNDSATVLRGILADREHLDVRLVDAAVADHAQHYAAARQIDTAPKVVGAQNPDPLDLIDQLASQLGAMGDDPSLVGVDGRG